LARDLTRLLADVTSLYAELGMHMRAKLEAMKQADADRIQSITARETTLIERASEREGLRRQITSRLLGRLGQAEKDAQARPVTLTRLAEWLPEPRRSQLLVAATGLREKVKEVERMRMATSLISQKMLEHLGEIVKVMSSGVGSDVYSRSGQTQQSGSATVFEAVG
jgi:hypothetical protein